LWPNYYTLLIVINCLHVIITQLEIYVGDTLKIETLSQENHQIKLSVEIDDETFQTSKRKAAKSIAKKIKIPGFRPGKAPYHIILRQVGEGAVTEEAIDVILKDVYPQIIDDAKITPYGPGQLENIASMEPPVLEFSIPLSPEVTIGDYRSIKLGMDSATVTDEDVDKVIDNLRENQAILEPVERAVKVGDMAYIVLSAVKKDEEDEAKKNLVDSRKFPIVVEKKSKKKDNQEYPYPGFSNELVGLNIGDKKTIEYTFDSKYEFEELRGVTGVYDIEIEEIKSRSLPAVDDEFAKSVGEEDTVENMKAGIQKNLVNQNEKDSKAKHENDVLEKILALSTVLYPPQMLQDEIDTLLQDLTNRLSQQGLTMDLYLKSRSMDMEAMREELVPTAEERLNRGLVMMELSNSEKIEISSEEVKEKTSEILAEINQYFPENEAKKLRSGEALQGLVSRVITDEINIRTLARISALAQGKEFPLEEEENKEDKEEVKKPAKKKKPKEVKEVVVSEEKESDQAAESKKEDTAKEE
jgi:trigger factor